MTISLDDTQRGEEDVEALAARIASKIEVLQSEKKDIEEAIENYKEKMAVILGEGEKTIGSQETGFYKFNAYVGKPFNAAQAEKNLPHERWLAASKAGRVTTAALAKKVLTEEEYALCQKPNGKTTIVVERLTGDDD